MLFPLRRYAYLTLALLFLQTVLPTVSWGQTLPLPSGPFPDAPNIPAPPLPAPPTEDGALPPPEGTPAPAPLVVPVLDGVTELQRLLRGLSGSRGLQSDMMSDPEDWSTMGMTSEPVHVEVGPVSSLLAGSALVSLTAPLTGVQMGTAIGRGTMTGIVGSVSPVRQTDTLTGY